jgi:hypothetical protein
MSQNLLKAFVLSRFVSAATLERSRFELGRLPRASLIAA